MADFKDSARSNKSIYLNDKDTERSGFIVDLDSLKPNASKLWERVSTITQQVNAKMKTLLSLLGAMDDKMLPFWKSFKNETELGEGFGKIMPKENKENESQHDDDSWKYQFTAADKESTINELPSIIQVEHLTKQVLDADQIDAAGATIVTEEDDVEIEKHLKEDHFYGFDHSKSFISVKNLLI